MNPLEREITKLWRLATKGRRWVAMTLVLVVALIPGLAQLITFYSSAAQSIWTILTPKTSELNEGEKEALDEWVAVISAWPTEKIAEEKKKEFKDSYVKYENQFRQGETGAYSLWRDDIWVARDFRKENHWLVIVDMWTGPSSEASVSAELARISRLGNGNPEAENIYQTKFTHPTVICYSSESFEKAFGRIENYEAKTNSEGKEYVPCEPNES